MATVIRFPSSRDTFEAAYDFGRWCVVRRRGGRLVERTYWPDRHAAEHMAGYFAVNPGKLVAAFNDELPAWAVMTGEAPRA